MCRKTVGSSRFTVRSGQTTVDHDQPSTANGELSTGFTLIEILVALAIVSAIMTMVYGSYAATTRSLDLYNSRMACSERASLMLRLMSRQLRCAYLPSPQAARPQPPQTQPIAFGDPPTGNTPNVPPVAFRADSHEASGVILCFPTTGGPRRGPDRPAGLSRVAYRYDPQGGTLSIHCEPCTQRAVDLPDPGQWRPMLTGVTNVDLQFHDGRRWRPEWNSGERNTLPRAVKIALTIVDKSGRVRAFATTAPIGLRNAPQEQQLEIPAEKL
jgi:general secretion pathway protein J